MITKSNFSFKLAALVLISPLALSSQGFAAMKCAGESMKLKGDTYIDNCIVRLKSPKAGQEYRDTKYLECEVSYKVIGKNDKKTYVNDKFSKRLIIDDPKVGMYLFKNYISEKEKSELKSRIKMKGENMLDRVAQGTQDFFAKAGIGNGSDPVVMKNKSFKLKSEDICLKDRNGNTLDWERQLAQAALKDLKQKSVVAPVVAATPKPAAPVVAPAVPAAPAVTPNAEPVKPAPPVPQSKPAVTVGVQ
jgi:hypothetical protein